MLTLLWRKKIERYFDCIRKNRQTIALYSAMMMAASFSFSFALFNIGIVILIVLYAILIVEQKKIVFDPYLDFSIVLFFVISVFSLTQTNHLMMSLEGVQKLFRYLLTFVAARYALTTKRDLKLMVMALLVGGAVVSLDGLFQYVVGQDLIRGRTPVVSFDGLVRISGCFKNPNQLVIYLCFLIPLACALLRYSRYKRILFVSALLFMSAALILTFSRTGLLALMGSTLFLLTMKRDIKAGVALCVVLGCGVLLLPQEVLGWLMSLDSWKELLVDSSRALHHQTAWNMIHHSPWLGIGLNSFDVSYAAFKLPEDPTTRWSAHQAYLQLTAETGILGFLSFLLILIVAFRLNFKHYKTVTAVS